MLIYVTLYFAYKGVVGFSAGDIMPEVPAPQAVLQNPVLRLTRRPVGVIPGRSICPLPASLFTRTSINIRNKNNKDCRKYVYIYL
jgi:hypothetical protein